MYLQRISACCRLHSPTSRRAQSLRSPPNICCARARFFPRSRHFFRASPVEAQVPRAVGAVAPSSPPTAPATPPGSAVAAAPFVSGHGTSAPSRIFRRRGPFVWPHGVGVPPGAADAGASFLSARRVQGRDLHSINGPSCIRKTDTVAPSHLSSSSTSRGMDSPKTKRSAAAAAFPSLPDDAIVDILSCVPAKSLCRFKCVSKGWRDLISDCLRCKKLPQTLEGFFYDDYEIHDGKTDDGYGKGEASGENSPRILRGNFINTLGRSVPLVNPSFSFLQVDR
ncbi:hypothetical protein U9M48_041613 [Paspalum notatum var. saurae]|uniref:F-box domain-containing protein n=1 Tax=Paspalum notatum var. saurae TaxID=547442 RepID=A0AAQ3XGQ5_PASNO